MSSAAVVTGALRVKISIFSEYLQISFLKCLSQVSSTQHNAVSMSMMSVNATSSRAPDKRGVGVGGGGGVGLGVGGGGGIEDNLFLNENMSH